MEMTGSGWSWIVIIGVIIGVYYLYKRGKIPWLKGKMIKMPKLLEPKPETQVERLKAATEREVARAEELRSVLEAKTELAKARAVNAKLRKEIDSITEKSVGKEQEPVVDNKVKPRRL